MRKRQVKVGGGGGVRFNLRIRNRSLIAVRVVSTKVDWRILADTGAARNPFRVGSAKLYPNRPTRRPEVQAYDP